MSSTRFLLCFAWLWIISRTTQLHQLLSLIVVPALGRQGRLAGQQCSAITQDVARSCSWPCGVVAVAGWEPYISSSACADRLAPKCPPPDWLLALLCSSSITLYFRHSDMNTSTCSGLAARCARNSSLTYSSPSCRCYGIQVHTDGSTSGHGGNEK